VPSAAQVFSPLDEQWVLNASAYSDEMAQRMVWLSAIVPYAKCAAVFARIGEQIVPSTSIWRQTQRHGNRLSTTLAHQQQATVEPAQEGDRPVEPHHNHPKGISLDGGMVNTREEGWREFKLGVVFDIAARFECHPTRKYLVKMAHGVNMHYTAVLGSKAEFEPALWYLACQHHVPTAAHQTVVADGAVWIWDSVDYLFPQAHGVVDWYHARQHLVEAARTLYPTDDTHRHQWLDQMCDTLYAGDIPTLEAALIAADIPDQACYFVTHQSRMQYADFRQQGLPLGSGTVESGIKQFKQRLSGPGMRWKLANVQPMATLCAAVLSDTFDALWLAA